MIMLRKCFRDGRPVFTRVSKILESPRYHEQKAR
jgi:hypothetical protein